MRVGLIVEGATDGVVLEALLKSRCLQASVVVLHPKRDRTSGWSGIQKYLAQKGRDLERLKTYGRFCGLFIHADADIAGHQCSQNAAQQWQQAERRLLAWSHRDSWPLGVHSVIPVMCLETWICASQTACQNRRPEMECFSCARVVRNMHDNAMRHAMEQKTTRLYREVFAPALAENWEQVVRLCPEGAGRFTEALTAMEQTCGTEEEV